MKHLKVVIVSTAVVKGPAGTKPPVLDPNEKASEPFAAMFSAVDKLRECALDGKLQLSVGESDWCRRLTDMTCSGDDVSVCAVETIPFNQVSTVRHCVVPMHAGEGGVVRYYLWSEGTFSFPLASR